MKNKQKNSIKKTKQIRILNLLCVNLSVCILLFSNTSFAKGITENKINTSGDLENPIIAIIEEKKVDITNIEDTYISEFKILNFNEKENNNMNVKYNIEILRKYDSISEYTLYKNDVEIETVDNKTKYFKLGIKEKKIQEFKIEVKYDKENIKLLTKKLTNEGKNKNEIQKIIYNYEIKLNVIQIDK